MVRRGYFVSSGVLLCICVLVSGSAAAGTGTWTTKASMQVSRYELAAVTASNGKVYAVGGGNYGPTRVVEEYDPATDTWVSRAEMPIEQSGCAITIGNNDKVYVIGGYSYSAGEYVYEVYEYSPATNTWAARADAPSPPRSGARAAPGINGKIYVVGGSGCRDGDNCPLAVVDEYDPATDTGSTRASMPTARWNVGLVAASNGKIYAIGGYINGGTLSIVEEYDPLTDTWVTRTSMPTARFGMGASVGANGRIYVIGGGTSYPPVVISDVVEEYDPIADSWTTVASMPTARYGLGAAASNGKIFAIGGVANDPLTTVEEFTPPGTDLLLAPTASTVFPGDPVSITLNLQDAADLYAAQVTCTVDPGILTPQLGTFGSLFDPVNVLLGANGPGAVAGSWQLAISQRSPAAPLSGGGWFATIDYTAAGPGVSAVTCDDLLLSDINGKALGSVIGALPSRSIPQ